MSQQKEQESWPDSWFNYFSELVFFMSIFIHVIIVIYKTRILTRDSRWKPVCNHKLHTSQKLADLVLTRNKPLYDEHISGFKCWPKISFFLEKYVCIIHVLSAIKVSWRQRRKKLQFLFARLLSKLALLKTRGVWSCWMSAWSSTINALSSLRFRLYIFVHWKSYLNEYRFCSKLERY